MHDLDGQLMKSYPLERLDYMKVCDFAVTNKYPHKLYVLAIGDEQSFFDGVHIICYNWTTSGLQWSFERKISPGVWYHPRLVKAKLELFKNGQYFVILTSYGLYLLDNQFNVSLRIQFEPRVVCLSVDSETIYTLNEENRIVQYLV